jgi:opacity protein-like surface antigen
MRHRLLVATMLILASAPALSARATGPVPDLTIHGVFGTVHVNTHGLRTLVDRAPYTEPAELFAGLGAAERIAFDYAMNPALMSGYEVDGRCGATVEECDPADPAQPPAEVVVTQPPPPPPVPTTKCQHEENAVTARGALFHNPLYTFTQYSYRCWDGAQVTFADAYGGYDVFYPWWECISTESPAMPYTTILPPGDAPTVTVSTTGQCAYHPNFEVNGRGIEARLQEKHPTITVAFQSTGASLLVKAQG